jgi:Fanconi anemia group M protein
MKSVHNIFTRSSQKEKKEKCPNPKTKIIVDTREKQSLIVASLFEKKANIEFEQLEIGDYLIEDTIIERKTFSDFIGSIINKRLVGQLTNLKKYPKYFLILEGFDYNYQKFNIHENAIRGMLISIATEFKIPIIFSEGFEDTAKFLILTAKKYEKPKSENSLRQSKTLKSLEEQKQFILEGFPGIGPTLAKNLLKKFSTLKNIFNAGEDELKETPKFNENKIKKYLELLSSNKNSRT